MKPINFRQAKKRALRQRKAESASENAVKYGRTKAEKDAEARDAETARRHLDGHRREP